MYIVCITMARLLDTWLYRMEQYNVILIFSENVKIDMKKMATWNVFAGIIILEDFPAMRDSLFNLNM